MKRRRGEGARELQWKAPEKSCDLKSRNPPDHASLRKGVNALVSFCLSLIPYQYAPWPNTPRSHKAREPVHAGPPLGAHLQSRVEKDRVDLGRLKEAIQPKGSPPHSGELKVYLQWSVRPHTIRSHLLFSWLLTSLLTVTLHSPVTRKTSGPLYLLLSLPRMLLADTHMPCSLTYFRSQLKWQAHHQMLSLTI